MSQISAFILGATGYVGGSVLATYLKKHPEIRYTATVRNPKDIQAIEALGVRVVQGSNADLDLIEKLASEHDLVINFADSDDVPLTKAVIKGLQARAKGTGATKKSVYIQTSGTGLATDAPTGEFRDNKILDDASVEDIRNIDPKQPHRDVDLEIFAASEEGSIDTFIVAPSTIYGTGRGPVRNISIQANDLIRVAVKHKQVLQIGAGTNIWDNVHIDDLVDLYVLVLEEALAFKTASPWERFYWGSARTHIWGDITKDLGVRLHRRGLVDTVEVKSIKLEEVPKLLTVAANSRTVANRSRALGWNPSRPTLAETLEEEIDLTLSQL